MRKLERGEFIKYVDELIKIYKKQEQFITDLGKCFPTAFESIYEFSSIELTIDLLSDMMNDEWRWIDHYFLENKCNGFSWTDNTGAIHLCRTPADLWNLITDYGKDDES